MAAALARFVNRFAVAVVGFWVLLAAAANITVPQLEQVIHEHSRAFFPADAEVRPRGRADGTGVRRFRLE